MLKPWMSIESFELLERGGGLAEVEYRFLVLDRIIANPVRSRAPGSPSDCDCLDEGVRVVDGVAEAEEVVIIDCDVAVLISKQERSERL